jgi:hypothetical protein
LLKKYRGGIKDGKPGAMSISGAAGMPVFRIVAGRQASSMNTRPKQDCKDAFGGPAKAWFHAFETRQAYFPVQI